MKINLRQGFKRIIIVAITCVILCFLGFYVKNGLILDKAKFINNTQIVLIDKKNSNNFYIIEYLRLLDIYVVPNDFECHPYKQECRYKYAQHIENRILKSGNIHSLHGEKIINFKVQMPSKLQYFLWQLTDFIKITIFVFCIFLGYLLLNHIIHSWCRRDFKECFRRIAILIIIVITSSLLYSKYEHGYLNKDKFYQNTFMITQNNEKFLLHEFDNLLIDLGYIDMDKSYDFNYICKPFERYCINHEFPNQEIKEGDVNELNINTKIVMPALHKVIWWALVEFFVVILYAIIMWIVYLIFEKITLWVIAGFKADM
ncbi:unknown [Clostridium sp. CAG:306]|nr:unknown [Clostridium sp. CAG:306]